MGSNHIRIDHLIISNMKDNHFGQVRIKGLMQHKDLDLHQMCLKDQQYLSNSSSNKECTSRQFSISRGPDEVTCSHRPDPATFPHNNSESERERECSHVEKWKRIISTSTVAAEINRSRLRTRCQLIGAATRENCPIVVSSLDRLGKEIKF
ncbi:hypothetical protein CR513_12609, partial [Mucuna pruriens]